MKKTIKDLLLAILTPVITTIAAIGTVAWFYLVINIGIDVGIRIYNLV